MRKTFLLFALSLLAIGCSNDLNDVQDSIQGTQSGQPEVSQSKDGYGVKYILTFRSKKDTSKTFEVGSEKKAPDLIGQWYIIDIWYRSDFNYWKKQLDAKGIPYLSVAAEGFWRGISYNYLHLFALDYDFVGSKKN